MESVAIIGVGRLGSAMAQEIIRANCIPDLYLANRSRKRLDSVLLSLEVFRSFSGSQTRLHRLLGPVPAEVSIVVIAIKEQYDPRLLIEDEVLPIDIERNVRNIGLLRDLPQVLVACKRLHGYRGIVVIVSNPVDLFCGIMKRLLPEAQVIGLGLSLDAVRFAYTATQVGYACCARDCPLGGSHVGGLVALRSLWPEGSAISSLTSQQVDELISSSRSIGPRELDGLGFTLYDCGPVLSKDILGLAGAVRSSVVLYGALGASDGILGGPIGMASSNVRLQFVSEAVSGSELNEIHRISDQLEHISERVWKDFVFDMAG